MVLPQITCRTFGVRVFIRVPSPAARMMTAAGPLALTRLLGIGAGKRLEAPPAGSRSGLPQDTASPGGTPRDGQSRARRPGTRPGHGLTAQGAGCPVPGHRPAGTLSAGRIIIRI